MAKRVRWTYEFTRAHRRRFLTELMFRALGVASCGCYRWLKCPQSARAVDDARLLRLLRASFKASQSIYWRRGCSSFCGRWTRPAASIAWPPDARGRAPRAEWLPHTPLAGWHASRADAKPPKSPSFADAVERRRGNGPHAQTDVAGVAQARGRDRPVLPQGDRVGGRTDNPLGTSPYWARVGREATTTARHHRSLRSGRASRLRCLAALLPLQSP